jgi:hypothetical protein
VAAFDRVDAATAGKIAAGVEVATLDIPAYCLSRLFDLHPHEMNEHLLHEILLLVEVASQSGRHTAQRFDDSMVLCHLTLLVFACRRRLGNHKVPVTTKGDDVRIDGEPHKAARPAFSTGLVNGCDKCPERQSFLVIGLHGRTISWQAAPLL